MSDCPSPLRSDVKSTLFPSAEKQTLYSNIGFCRNFRSPVPSPFAMYRSAEDGPIRFISRTPFFRIWADANGNCASRTAAGPPHRNCLRVIMVHAQLFGTAVLVIIVQPSTATRLLASHGVSSAELHAPCPMPKYLDHPK